MKKWVPLFTMTLLLCSAVSCTETPSETKTSYSWQLILEKPSSVPIGLQIWKYADFFNDGTFVLSVDYYHGAQDTDTFQYSDSGNVIRIYDMYGKDWIGTMPSGAIQAGNTVQFKAESGEGYFALKYLGNSKEKNQSNDWLILRSGGRTRTSDLWVMSPTSYQLLHSAI